MRTWIVERYVEVHAQTANKALEEASCMTPVSYRVYEKSDAPRVADEIRELLDRLEPLGWGPEVTELMRLTRKLVGQNGEDL